MKSLKLTITVCAIICLAINGFAHAQANTESGQESADDSGKPLITEEFFDHDLRDVLNIIANITGVNIMCPDTADGIITCKLNEQPLDKALEIILAATPYVAKEMDGYYLVTLRTSQKLEISGAVGAPGVVMNGLPGNVVSDSSGHYTAIVDFGWAGTVQPIKEGYEFRPPAKVYSAITDNKTNQNYEASICTFIISGRTGVARVRMRGLPGEPTTGPNGSYSATVAYGWSGTVTPQREGYTFEPASRTYSKVIGDHNSESYKAEMIHYTISGTILSDKGEPVEGVKLLTNSGDSIVTDEDGIYYLSQEHGWSGMLTPFQDGYAFTPKLRQYRNINRDQTNQNYKAEVQMLTISDVVEVKDQPVPGVEVNVSNGNSVITDSRGQFKIEVPYGWSGEITLSKPGITFNPPSKTYTNVTTDIINGIPAPSRPTMGGMGAGMLSSDSTIITQVRRTGTGRMLIIPAEDIESENVIATREDMQVMAEILDERFREPRMIEGVFRDFGDFFGRDNGKTEAVYIQGYGVVFMIEVDYTFSIIPPIQEQTSEENNQEGDSTWQQARARILWPGSNLSRRDVSQREREYENQMVEILKTELIRALKYAANIRNLRSDEWVILSVAGNNTQGLQISFDSAPSGSSSYGASGSYAGGYGQYSISYEGSSSSYGQGMGGMMGGYGDGTYGGGMMGGYGGGAYGGGMMGGYGGGVYGGGMMGGYGGSVMAGYRSSPSVLTMRVKKSDVDEFASDKLDFEKFSERVKILMY